MKIFNANELRDTLGELIYQTSTYDVVQALIAALDEVPQHAEHYDETQIDAGVLREIVNQLH